ncbi:MAG: hypothetical protein E6K80_14835 [Candidatus Eisenbacteria bacterium]|uniref:Uncharacterized protein n=1 Tax=Eiseniibacteriota bacterium TaxID=2212470 RepID=A0A538TWC1_UNCEI|nr:MAG: hypothetical protein E6K80_14835 [Candidatus Eisenbacteria bacterium]
MPKIDEYEFAVQADPCWGIWDIMDTSAALDSYPQGNLWLHSRWIDDPCHLRIGPRAFGGDLCFNVRVCDATTPVKKASWGQLKSIYRRSEGQEVEVGDK